MFLDDPEESQSKTNKATPEREGAWKSTKEIKEYFNNAEKKTAHGLLRNELKKKKKRKKESKELNRNQGWTHLGLSLTDNVVVWKSQLSWMAGA